MKILVVEDEPITARELKFVLRKLDKNVEMLNLKQQRIDISLMLCFGLSIISLAQQYFDSDREKWTFFIIPFCVIFLSLNTMWFLVFRFLQPKSEKSSMYEGKDIVLSLSLSLLILLIFSFLGFKLENHFFGVVEGITLERYLWIYLFRGFFLFGLVLLFKYLLDNRQLRQDFSDETKTLREANTRAQFEILKQQINPHFLFNALSTLKSLIRLQDPNAEKFVMSLSDVYRKLLQRRDQELIRLGDEMEIVNAYLFMQQLRFENNLKVETNIQTTDLQLFILPFALQLLIENTIKHNVISMKKPLTVRIFVNEQKQIVVENSIQPKKIKEESTGWGLSSLIERYTAFTKQTIEIKQTETIFTIALPLLTSE
jgi:two-component system, LytTR family, sensor kinase